MDSDHFDLSKMSQTDMRSVQEISTLTVIKSLNLQDNHISEIPSDIASFLPDLEMINLNNNMLHDVEQAVDALSTLPKLKSLFLNLNQEE